MRVTVEAAAELGVTAEGIRRMIVNGAFPDVLRRSPPDGPYVLHREDLASDRSRPQWALDGFLSIDQAAEELGVPAFVVCRLFRTGLLRGWPASFREVLRVHRDSIAEYVSQHNAPDLGGGLSLSGGEAWFTPAEAAVELGCTPQHVYMLIKDGKLHAERADSKRRTTYRIHAHWLDEYLAKYRAD